MEDRKVHGRTGRTAYLKTPMKKGDADGVWSVSPLKKVKREAAAQRRPARSEPEKPRFFRETTGYGV